VDTPASTQGKCRLRRLFRWVALVALLSAAGAAAPQPPDPASAADSDKLGIGHLDEPRGKDLALAPGMERSAQVAAAEERWQSTGVLVKEGRHYRIEASGEWQVGIFCNRSGPSGEGVYTPLLCFPSPVNTPIVRGFTFGALIAKIGKDGRPFAVGAGLELDAERDGLLYFRINDGPGWAWDNTGQVTASIKLVQAAPAADPAQPPGVAQPEERTPAAAAGAPGLTAAVRAEYWAVVIGVSQYADTAVPPLRYASADARAFYDWLVSPEGGRYAPARARLLLDRDATAANIKDALYSWLKQTIEEDIVVIYFAGHGSPDAPETPQNLYLLPYDTRYDSIAATGFPMWDIETALKRFIKARRVIVLADACHAGGVGASFDIARRGVAGPESNRISRGLQNLSTIGDGIAVLSASDDKQLSAESARFGGGHGVFTWYLLSGLRGEADYSRDGRVTLGELIPYVSEQVRRATANAQSPTIAGRFDPALSIGR
jgi:uncharacterized caspase-like protein